MYAYFCQWGPLLNGECLLLLTPTLQLLLNDSQQRTIVTNGLESIAMLIRRFAEVENIYLRKTRHRLSEDLEEALCTLYCHIREFEARSICQFDRNTAHQTGRNIVKADGWQDILTAIEKSETTCNILTRIIDTETQHKWNDEIEALISTQTDLVDKTLKLSEQTDSQVRQQSARNDTSKNSPSKIETECLALFRTTDYEFDKNKNPTRLVGTCEWFLKHPTYKSWCQNDSVGWLWVTANPGCGKSVLARSLIDELSNAAKEPQVCYFFFKDDTEKHRSINHALCAIIHQLICRDKTLLRYAMDGYHSDGDLLPDLVEPLWKIFLSVLEALREPVICVLDALDECSESSRILLIKKLAAIFSDEPHQTKFKVVITSRPNTPMGTAIWGHGVDPVSIQLTGEREIESQVISEEIDLYIAAKVRNFRELREHRGIKDEAHVTLHETLRGIENRTYLWVSLIFPELESHMGVSRTKLCGLVKQVPRTVQEAYEKILSRSENAQLARLLLHIVIAAYRPLTLVEMNTALAVQDHSDPTEDLDTEPVESFETTVRDICGLFIMVKDSRIYLIHQTAKEFLMQTDERRHVPSVDLSLWNWRSSFDPADSHRILARICMLYLYMSYPHRKESKWDYSVWLPEPWMKTQWGVFFEYTSDYWMKHLPEAGLYGATSIESPVANICVTPSDKIKFTWAQLYQSAPDWSPSPKKDVVKVKFNALNMASFHGHDLMIKLNLKAHAATEKGIPSIRWALQNNHTAIAHELLDTVSDTPVNGAILNAAFHIACSSGERAVVSRLMSYSNVDLCHADSLGRTGLFWAARDGNPITTQLLIEAIDRHRWARGEVGSSLLVAAFRGHGDVIALLESCFPDESNEFRVAALYQAISCDHAHVVQSLLEKHDSVAISQIDLEKLVVVAITHKRQASTRVLLQYPFNVNARDSSGRTLLFLAADIIMKETLIKSGADINAIASLGWSRCYEGIGETLLYHAILTGDCEFARILLEDGADVNVRCRNGETALYRAVAATNFELGVLLLNAGADPMVGNKSGVSPFGMAKGMSDSLPASGNMSGDQVRFLALTDHATYDKSEQTDVTPDTTKSRTTVPSLRSYHELLEQASDSIDWEQLEQVFSLDDPDDNDEHQYTRDLYSDIFQQYQKQVLEQAKESL